MDINAIIDSAPQILTWVGAVTVALTSVHAAALAIAKVTKTDKDDKILAKVGKWLDVVIKLTGRIGVDLTKGK